MDASCSKGHEQNNRPVTFAGWQSIRQTVFQTSVLEIECYVTLGTNWKQITEVKGNTYSWDENWMWILMLLVFLTFRARYCYSGIGWIGIGFQLHDNMIVSWLGIYLSHNIYMAHILKTASGDMPSKVIQVAHVVSKTYETLPRRGGKGERVSTSCQRASQKLGSRSWHQSSVNTRLLLRPSDQLRDAAKDNHDTELDSYSKTSLKSHLCKVTTSLKWQFPSSPTYTCNALQSSILLKVTQNGRTDGVTLERFYCMCVFMLLIFVYLLPNLLVYLRLPASWWCGRKNVFSNDRESIISFLIRLKDFQTHELLVRSCFPYQVAYISCRLQSAPSR